ncbi:MAG: LysM peptidoglycan-binding domain-containing protein, partial [Streptosporangiales bacterium]|nr:LysM peptidoglycan-binding domain-containing protein [Streptosporangiales bacterium]
LMTRDDGQLFIATLTYLAWACWALLAILVVLEGLAQLRGRPTPHVPGLGPVQWLARVLVSGLTAAVLAAPGTLARSPTPPPPAPAAVATAPPAPTTSTPGRPTHGSAVEPVADHHPTHASAAPGPHAIYIVQPRDTLWGIAERRLGDGHRYADIAELNYGRPQPDGSQLTSSHWIRPGWRLLLPADASPDATGTGRWYTVTDGDTLRGIATRRLGDADRYREIARLNHGRAQPDGGRLTDPDLIRPGWRLLLPDTAREDKPPSSRRPSKPADRRPSTPPPSQAPSTASPPASSPATSTPSAPPSTTQASPATAEPGDHQQRQVISLPSGALASGTLASVIGAAITLIFLRRRRRYRALADPPVAPTGPETNPTAQRLRRAYLADLPTDADEEQGAINHGHTRRHGSAVAGDVPIAARDGEEITVTLPTLEGLALNGPGADAAARAVLITLIATDTTEIVTTEADLRRLLCVDDTATVPLPPAVTILPTLAAAVEHMETEILHRSRLLANYDIPDLDTLRRDQPDEPLSTLVLLAGTADRDNARLAAALMLGRNYHIGGIVLGNWTRGTGCHIATDGHVTTATGPYSHQLDGTRLFQLPAPDSTDLLAVLAAATTPNDEHATNAPQPPAHEPRAPSITAPDTTTANALVQLDVFGTVRVSVHGVEIATGVRTKARELLAYLATQPDGITLDHAITDCWPDTEPDQAANQFRTVIGNIRDTLRNASGARHAKFVIYTAGRYHLDTHTFDVDLWRFTHHLHPSDEQDPIDKLTQALHVYHGKFTDSHDYAWAEPLRESLHRNAIDAHARLAEHHHHDGNTEQAITVLDHAITLDPYNEDLYQRSIQLLGELGRTDAIRRLYRQLQNRLADLDVDPDPATEGLASQHLNRSR